MSSNDNERSSTAKGNQQDDACITGETKDHFTSAPIENASDRNRTTGASKESDPSTAVCAFRHDESTASSNDNDLGKEERISMLRKRNAVYSKRKYYKKKKEISNLESTKFDLEAKNQALKQENSRLETILAQARQKVAVLSNYPPADFGTGGPLHAQIPGVPAFTGLPSLYSYGSLPYGSILGSSTGVGGTYPIGAGPFGSAMREQYMFHEAYLRNSMLQQERERMINLQRTPAIAHTREMANMRHGHADIGLPSRQRDEEQPSSDGDTGILSTAAHPGSDILEQQTVVDINSSEEVDSTPDKSTQYNEKSAKR